MHVLTSMLIFLAVCQEAPLTMNCVFFPGVHSHLTQPPVIFYGVRSRLVLTCPLCHMIYRSCSKGSWRQSLLPTMRYCNMHGRASLQDWCLPTSPMVDISSTYKVGHKLKSLSLSVDMHPLPIVTIQATVPQNLEILEGLTNRPVYCKDICHFCFVCANTTCICKIAQ
jgi:hypothetical protein